MKTSKKYSDIHVDQIYKILESHIRNDKPADFEIYIDEHLAVARTNDLKQFYGFKSLILDHNKAVRIKVFHGSSRNNKEHTLWLKEEENIMTQEDVDRIVEERAEEIRQQLLKEEEERKREQQFQENLQTVQKQKKKIARLKKRIRTMQREKDSTLGSLVQALDVYTQNLSQKPAEEDELTKLFHAQRQRVAPAIFESALEVAFRLCNTPELIATTNQFIIEKQQANEEIKKAS